MTKPETEQFSLVGAARKETMLGELVQVMQDTRRRRRTRRRVGAAGATTVGLVLLLWIASQAPPGGPTPERIVENLAPHMTDLSEIPIPSAACIIKIVRNDPNVVGRYRAKPMKSRIERIGDRTLVETLASINRPAGLIQFGDSIRLSAPVTDDELGF